jgi:hypothetical protein
LAQIASEARLLRSEKKKKGTYVVLNCVQLHQDEHLVLALRLLAEAQLGRVAARHEGSAL